MTFIPPGQIAPFNLDLASTNSQFSLDRPRAQRRSTIEAKSKVWIGHWSKTGGLNRPKEAKSAKSPSYSPFATGFILPLTLPPRSVSSGHFSRCDHLRRIHSTLNPVVRWWVSLEVRAARHVYGDESRYAHSQPDSNATHSLPVERYSNRLHSLPVRRDTPRMPPLSKTGTVMPRLRQGPQVLRLFQNSLYRPG